MSLRSYLLAVLTATTVLLGGGVAFADTDEISTREEALQSITDGVDLIDAGTRSTTLGRAKVAAGQNWLVANPDTGTPTRPADDEVTVTATQVDDRRARVDWVSTRDDVTGWLIGRDGTDTRGHGSWSTELPPDARTFTFDLLNPGDTYHFTLIPRTESGEPTPVVTSVRMDGEPVSTPPVPGPTTPPTTPPDRATEAAVRYGWGAPIHGSDEFDYTGRVDAARWHTAGECWPGHDGNGRRCASHSTVNGSTLVMTGLANGDSGWLGHKVDRRYGRWEARVRSHGTGPGHAYRPLLIIWPTSNRWPQDGEYDFWENRTPNSTCAGHFIHYPHPPGPVHQEGGWCERQNIDLNQWHNVAIEWTPQHVKGFVDGQEWFSYSGGAGPGGRSAIQSMPSGHLTIQLDNFHGSGMQPASYEIDWVRLYH